MPYFGHSTQTFDMNVFFQLLKRCQKLILINLKINTWLWFVCWIKSWKSHSNIVYFLSLDRKYFLILKLLFSAQHACARLLLEQLFRLFPFPSQTLTVCNFVWTFSMHKLTNEVEWKWNCEMEGPLWHFSFG